METETISSFWQTVDKSSFEAAVIIFQDKISGEDKKKFDIPQWMTVLEILSNNNEIIKEALSNIKDLDPGSFSVAQDLFMKSSSNPEVKKVLFSKALSLAKTPREVCYLIVKADEGQKPSCLEKLKNIQVPFEEWKSFVILSKKRDEFSDIAFENMKQSEASFDDWKNACLAFRSFSNYYLVEAAKELRKKADTFARKEILYRNIFSWCNDFVSFEELGLDELEKALIESAKTASNLAWVYQNIEKTDDIKQKIFQAEDTSTGWLYINQIYDDLKWLADLSLKRMKQLAKNFDDWSIIWCRDFSKQGKEQACSKMIESASDRQEAQSAWHRAKGTDLEETARQKLEQIVQALQ